MQKIIIIYLLLLTGCSTTKNEFRKYDIEKGIITYSIKIPFKEKLIAQRVYFTDYGATEYIEFINEEDFPTFPIFKKDSLEYVFVTDSMTTTSNRGFDFVYEKLIVKNKSKLLNNDLIINRKSDTVIDSKKCDLIEFKISHTGQRGKAALWKGIPIWVNSELEKGLFENISLLKLDLTSEIPIEKTKIMDYVDSE